jgi:hypothetical protein
MAHRVVVMYSRDDVVAARKLAGLAVHLGLPDQAPPPVTSIRVGLDDGGKDLPGDTSISVVDTFDSQSAGDEARKAIRSAIGSKIKNWSKPLHGIAIHAGPARDMNGKTLLVDYVKKVAVESSGSYGTIPGGGTIYYAIVFRRPILGARQSLRIAVAQSNAADEPITWDLQ